MPKPDPFAEQVIRETRVNLAAVMCPKTCVWIPIPPSANRIWRTSGDVHHKSKQYKDWLKVAVPMLAQLGVMQRYPCQVELAIHPGKGWRGGRDIDNCIKPVIDALRLAGVIVSDNAKHVNGVSIKLEAKPDNEAKMAVQVWQSRKEIK